ncbi:MAG: hypothetical protein WA632_06865, partial [Gallionella sp.]
MTKKNPDSAPIPGRTFAIKGLFTVALVVFIVVFSSESSAIPSFSRQANMGCKACHSQHVPILNGFGQSFKASGYPIMGPVQGKIEADDLSIPNTLNASMLFKGRYQTSNCTKTNNISGDSTNGGQWQIPDEFSLYFGGRIAQTVGFFFEGNATSPHLITGFKLPSATYFSDAKLSVIPFLTETQGASYGYEQSSTGAARNVIWAEHRKEVSAQQYIGSDTPATGFTLVAQNDNGYINLTRWAPAFMARKDGAQTLSSSYIRFAITPTLTTTRGDWAIQTGFQVWRGTNYAYDSLTLASGLRNPLTPTGGPGLMKVDTEASAFDLQAFGQLAGRELGIYFTWARSPGGTASRPNILNVSRPGTNPVGSAEPMLYRLDERKAWTMGAEYSLIPNKLHLGMAYRNAKTGGPSNVYDGTASVPTVTVPVSNPTDNAITLTAVYNLSQNIEFHVNESFYSGT